VFAVKRLIRFILVFILCFSVTGCSNASESESSGSPKHVAVNKWFDCLHGDEMIWDGVREINIEEYPDVTFRCYPEKLEAVTEKDTFLLFQGMPIWSVYFCDLTGDGKPELCASISLGSGIVDNRIIVYDYAGGASYELSGRGKFDYVLNTKNDSLIAEKRVYRKDELVESGELVFQNETFQVKAE
jgi:hypothetical protein